MTLCEGTTKDGNPCKKNVKPGSSYCHLHKNQGGEKSPKKHEKSPKKHEKSPKKQTKGEYFIYRFLGEDEDLEIKITKNDLDLSVNQFLEKIGKRYGVRGSRGMHIHFSVSKYLVSTCPKCHKTMVIHTMGGSLGSFLFSYMDSRQDEEGNTYWETLKNGEPFVLFKPNPNT